MHFKNIEKKFEEVYLQKQNFIFESIKQNRNRMLFFLLFTLYSLLTVLGTTDRDFFFENGIKFPLLNIELPLVAFYLVVPIIIILLHFNLLYTYREHQKNLEKHKNIKGFYKSMPIGIFDIQIINKGKLYIFIKIFLYFLIFIAPLLTLYLFWWYFNKYQNYYYSFLHLGYIFIDTLLIGHFHLSKETLLLSNELLKIRSRFTPFIFALYIIVFLIATIIQYIIVFKSDCLSKKIYPHLELSGEYLINFNYNQLQVLKSINKETPLALLQPLLNLENRSFKYANFSNALLIRVNFNNVDFQGANFSKANIQGAYMWKSKMKKVNMWKANLQCTNLWKADFQNAYLERINLQGAYLFKTNFKNANLKRANLQGADLRNANLQGADLSYAKLIGSNLKKAKLQGVNLLYTKLYGADLSYAQLQGANLWKAYLQGANLWKTNIQGVYCKEKTIKYIKQIKQQIGIKTNLNEVNKKLLTNEEKEKLIKNLQKIYCINEAISLNIKNAIMVIQNSNSSIPDLSKTIFGKYTKKQAFRWIEEY